MNNDREGIIVENNQSISIVIERPSPAMSAVRLFEGTLIFSRIFVESATSMGLTNDEDFAASMVFLRCAFCFSRLAAILEHYRYSESGYAS